MLKELFTGYPWWVAATAAGVLVLALAWFLTGIAGRFARTALQAALGGDTTTRSATVATPLRALRIVVFLVALALLVRPMMALTGLETTVGLDPRVLLEWLFGSGLRIAVIALLAYMVIRIVSVIASRFEHEVSQGTGLDVLERAKRARTLGNLVRKGVAALVFTIAGLMVLRELRIDILPVLTGAGIVGLAVGFGAQTLVKDVISGFFMILENQVRVGDVAAINGMGGLVEAITLRTIVLRDFDGTVYVFPNGSITTLANRTRDFSYYVIDLPIEHSADIDRVIDLLRRVGDELMADERLKPNILEPLEIAGVDDFTDSAVVIKMRIKTLPLKQWEVGRELRRRIKLALDAEGIRIPIRYLNIELPPELVAGHRD